MITAVVLTVLLALLFGGLVVVFGIVDHQRDLAIGGFVIAALLLVLAWRLGRGGLAARVAGIAVGAAVIVAGFLQSQGLVSLAVFGLLGLALIVVLTVPGGARAYLRERPSSTLSTITQLDSFAGVHRSSHDGR